MAKVIVVTTDSEEIDSSDEMKAEEVITEDASSFPVAKGMADFMDRMLSSDVSGKKVPILAKAKSDKERIKLKKLQSLQSVGTVEENVVSFENDLKTHSDDFENLLSAKERKERLVKKKLWEEMSHLRPPFSREEIEKSRKLKRIGTKGVVKLFNSVLQHQAVVNEKLKKVGTTESKREKVLHSLSKGQFLDLLQDGNEKNENMENKNDLIKVEIKEEPMDSEGDTWDVLRDEYLMNPEMKDWDKEDLDNDDSD